MSEPADGGACINAVVALWASRIDRDSLGGDRSLGLSFSHLSHIESCRGRSLIPPTSLDGRKEGGKRKKLSSHSPPPHTQCAAAAATSSLRSPLRSWPLFGHSFQVHLICFIRYSILIHVEKSNCHKTRDPFPLEEFDSAERRPLVITELKCTPRSLFCVSSLPAREQVQSPRGASEEERERSFISHLIVRVVVVSSSSSTLLAHVLSTSVKLVKPSHTSCPT